MAKSQRRRAAEESKQQQREARLAEYAPADKAAKRRESRARSKKWAKILRLQNPGSQPTTNAARASNAHDRRREREEARRKHPVIVRQGCTCPRLCDVHPMHSKA